MTQASELLALADRVEAATADDRTGLNNEVAAAVGWQRVTPSQMGRSHRSRGGWIAPDDYLGRQSDGRPILDSLHGTTIHRDPPAFIYSLDAAITLVPEGFHGRLGWCKGAAYAELLSAGQVHGDTTAAVTIPLAITAASLRALAAGPK